MFGPLLSSIETEAQVGFLFHVMIGVNPFGVFRSVSGIGRRVDAEEIREGGRNHSPHMRVGHAKYQECKIEWGLSYSSALYDWIHAVEAGYAYKRQVTVVQFDRTFTPLRIYMLWDAWPLSWEGARLNANDNAIDTEEITLAYEAVTLIPVPTEVSWTLPIPDSTILFVATPPPTESEAVEFEHEQATRDAEAYVEKEWEESEPDEARDPISSREAEEPTEAVWESTDPADPRAPAASRAAEAAAAPAPAATASPDYGDAQVGRATFPTIAFSSGNFYTHEAQAVKLSAGVFLEPTEWEPLTLGGET